MTPDRSNEATYVASVLTLYADLPDTPLRPSPTDQSLARKTSQRNGASVAGRVRFAARARGAGSLAPPISLRFPRSARSPTSCRSSLSFSSSPYPTAISTIFASNCTSSPKLPGQMFRNLRFQMSANMTQRCEREARKTESHWYPAAHEETCTC